VRKKGKGGSERKYFGKINYDRYICMFGNVDKKSYG